MESLPASDRYPELQALRGLAAAVVLLGHGNTFLGTAILPPALFNAHAAVVFFFVLSGYLLTVSLHRRPLTMGAVADYLRRRGFRIYPALIVVTILTAFFLALQGRPADIEHVATSAAGLSPALIPQAWTIFVELAAALLMVPLAWLAIVNRWLFGTGLAFLAAFSFLAGPDTYCQIAVYLVDFAIGAAAFAWRRRLAWPLMFIAALCLLIGRYAVPVSYHDPGAQFAEAVSAAILIIAMCGRESRLLRWRPLQNLGEISYSLYLCHILVLGVVASMIGPYPVPVLILGTLASLAAASLLYRYAERPGMRLGKVRLKWPARAVIRTSPSSGLRAAGSGPGNVPPT